MTNNQHQQKQEPMPPSLVDYFWTAVRAAGGFVSALAGAWTAQHIF